jgi:hypothetical protein
MFRRSRLSLLGVLILALGGWAMLGQQEPASACGERFQVGKFKLSGPHIYDNLTIYLVHGPDQLKGQKFLMLAEALEQKKFVIHETQRVNDLTMENLSDQEVIILAGDILKGGQQDRIAQHDQIVPPKSGKLPLQVFCVERTASRWGKPLVEKDKTFTASPGQLCTNDLRLACRKDGKQSQVWKEVGEAQMKLTRKLGVDVRDKKSDSSLALSLQAKEVLANVEKYVARLAKAPDGKKDVVGYVYAINGKVIGSDIYGSPALFQRVWPRLVRANATEAVAELPKDKKFAAVGPEAVRTFLDAASKGKVTARDDGKGLRQTTNEKARVLNFESARPALPGAPAKKAPLRSNSLTY